ncbi:hypothetical protein CFK38_03415 [Brachybacterium vulturis]|uniref:WXG100 family type VII secretion target n=1 Tax=Brachybacterium vulturis TaxID=2017484 RepID=A0A291GKU1_9MICO|nr:hypothetical protein [Brachybacterium vulturis]ATG50672.1 hypothetical protein CFK38_03415 [Brachybacterium vulturis]
MSGFYGADTGQLRHHTELLRTRARSLTELRERLQPAVMDESAWHGADADGFRTRWTSRTTALFDDLVTRIAQQAGDLEQHAEEQDAASSPTGSGGGSGGGGGGGASEGGADAGTSWWDRVTGGLEVYNTLQNAFSNGKDVWDTLRVIDRSTDLIDGAEDIFQLAAGTWKYGQDITGVVFNRGTEFSGLVSKLVGELPFPVPTGAGTRNFFGFVDDAAGWASKAAPFLDDVAPFVGKALPGLDVVFGGAQMIEGIQSGDTFSAITGGASALGGGLMLAGGAMSATGVGAVIGGPLVAAGAIISGGAALADVGRMVYDNWDSISATASDAWNATTDFVGDTAGAVADTAGDVVDSVSDGISDAVDGLADAMPW